MALIIKVVIALVLVAGLAAAPAASAATPFQFALGKEPDLAVDAQGTAHVIWTDTGTPVNERAIRYCRIPRGQRACQGEQVLMTGTEFGRPHVFVTPAGEIVAVAGLACQGGPCGPYRDRIVVRRSADGGETFGPADARSLTPLNNYGVPDDAVYGPGDSISTVSEGTSGAYFLNSPLAGPVQEATARLSTSSSAGAAVGLNGSQPVVVYYDQGARTIFSRAYSGAGGLNSPGSWGPAVAIDPEGTSDTALAGGPSGLFLIHTRRPYRGPVVRAFGPAGWTDGVTIGSGSVHFPDLAQDASGRLHAIWVSGSGKSARLLWRTSKDGVTWGPAVTVDVGGTHLPEMHVAAGPDGRGFVVWDARGGPNGGTSRLMASPLEPYTGPGSPVTKGDPCKWPNCLPAGGKPTAKVGGKKVTLGVTVPSCAKKRVKVELKKLKKKMGPWTVQKVVFRLGKAKKVDGKPVYRAFFPLKGASPAKPLAAAATIHLRAGKKKSKVKLTKRFHACPLA